ncbi:hypothetical protein OC861_003648 [Tilletia horrida]|nr:hypothetical protein OC861_003648 [Tilletia horrida]
MAALEAAWTQSLTRLDTFGGPSRATLAESLRQVDEFFHPKEAQKCAWKHGHEQVQEHLDAVVHSMCQDKVATAFLRRCEDHFDGCAGLLLDNILKEEDSGIELETLVEQSFQSVHVLMRVWRSPLTLDAFGSLFARLVRARFAKGHLDVLSQIMERLVCRVAEQSPVRAGTFIPSTSIWIDLGIADLAVTFLIMWIKSHVKRRVQALSSADFANYSDAEMDDAAVQSILSEGPYAHPVLPIAHSILGDTYAPVLHDWLRYFEQNNQKFRPLGGDLHSVLGSLHLTALTTLLDTRSAQIFDIIMDFPSSSPAISDLKDCLHLPNARESMIAQLALNIHQRLLHPGAQTSGIILTYLRMVSALRLIDESGVVLSRTAPPLRSYLRSRPDTVSAIVTALVGTDPAFESLRAELRRENTYHGSDARNLKANRKRKGKEVAKSGTTLTAGYDEHRSMDHDNEGDVEEFGHFDPEYWKNPYWQPRPVDAGVSFSATSNSDIVNMLVSIFDEEAHFVNALERSTAAELIKVKGYSPDKEVGLPNSFNILKHMLLILPLIPKYHNNLILKKRFGEAKLARCDVMLNDFPSSRRIDQLVHEAIIAARRRSLYAGAPNSIPVELRETVDALHPLIVSRQFWPSLEDGLTHDPAASAGAGPAGFGASGAATAARPKLGMMKMPGKMGEALSAYGKTFEQVKTTRKIHWLGGLGSVEVEIEMDDGRLIRDECSPAQAAVIEIAAGKATESLPVSTEELVLQLEADKGLVTAALQYWTSKGVLKELAGVPGSYEVVERL